MDLLHDLLWIFSADGIQWIIIHGGLPLICLIIFAETGFFALLPGDSLLLLCGIFAATPTASGEPLLPIAALLAVVPVCGILGDQVGYWIGIWCGRSMYTWRDRSFIGIPVFKKEYLTKTEDFYHRWGQYAIIMGRWVPIVRTFAPIIAGITRMPIRKFLISNVIGAFTWVWSMVLAGYFLGTLVKEKFGIDLVRHIDKIALAVVLLSILPIVYTAWKESKRAKT